MVKPDRSRYVWLYLASAENKKRWHDLAEKAGVPLSKFCISIIEERLSEDEDFKPRRAMVKELETLKAENKTLRDDLRQKGIVIERYEAELKRYRSAAFLSDDFRGMRRYSGELVNLLKTKGRMDSYAILESLGIDPTETESVRAVSRQLEELEAFNLIERDGRSWKWI